MESIGEDRGDTAVSPRCHRGETAVTPRSSPMENFHFHLHFHLHFHRQCESALSNVFSKSNIIFIYASRPIVRRIIQIIASAISSLPRPTCALVLSCGCWLAVVAAAKGPFKYYITQKMLFLDPPTLITQCNIRQNLPTCTLYNRRFCTTSFLCFPYLFSCFFVRFRQLLTGGGGGCKSKNFPSQNVSLPNFICYITNQQRTHPPL